jgi:hypothetical protein
MQRRVVASERIEARQGDSSTIKDGPHEEALMTSVTQEMHLRR